MITRSWKVTFVVFTGIIMMLVPVRGAADDRSGPSTDALLQIMEDSKGGDRPVQAEALFLVSCTQCHDAERATMKTKSYDEWMMTVRRMAAKPGANVPESDIEPIAEYLSSLKTTHEEEMAQRDIPTIGEVMAASSLAANATISLLWRKGDELVENEGFFPDVWVGAEWAPPENPFSAQITACTSCHDVGNGLEIELVEGSFRADLLHLFSGESAAERGSDLKLEARAGRFIVPFGAYSGMTHPGVYRTLTKPLMYNMGQRVGYYEPVLPMPYADEGVDVHLGLPLPLGLIGRLDGYAINGLQEFGFTPSRSYRDNNSDIALGGRASLGNSWVLIGGSYASGELQASGTPTKEYWMAGGDATVRYRDWIRVYYEYARREEDFTPTIENLFSGHVVEVEGLIWRNPKVTLLGRYDTIENSSSSPYGQASIERFTWGPGITLPGGSLFIINHEQWKHEAPLNNEDIVGIRWIAAF